MKINISFDNKKEEKEFVKGMVVFKKFIDTLANDKRVDAKNEKVIKCKDGGDHEWLGWKTLSESSHLGYYTQTKKCKKCKILDYYKQTHTDTNGSKPDKNYNNDDGEASNLYGCHHSWTLVSSKYLGDRRINEQHRCLNCGEEKSEFRLG